MGTLVDSTLIMNSLWETPSDFAFWLDLTLSMFVRHFLVNGVVSKVFMLMALYLTFGWTRYIEVRRPIPS